MNQVYHNKARQHSVARALRLKLSMRGQTKTARRATIGLRRMRRAAETSSQCSLSLPVERVDEDGHDEVESVLMKLAEDEPEINAHPAPRVRVRGFGQSGIDVQLMGWITQPADRGRISHIMFKKIHAAFRAHGLEIPYPKRDIMIKRES